MAISIDWPTGVITVSPADPEMTLVDVGPPAVYSLDVDAFRLTLKSLEDDAAGIIWPTTHNHNTAVGIGGVTLARVVELINGYTVTFDDSGGAYRVNLLGANNNILDVLNFNTVQVASANSAGLTDPDLRETIETEHNQIISHVWAASGRTTA